MQIKTRILFLFASLLIIQSAVLSMHPSLENTVTIRFDNIPDRSSSDYSGSTWRFTPDVSHYDQNQHANNEPFQAARPDEFREICHDSAVYNAREISQEMAREQQNMDQTESYPFHNAQRRELEPVSTQPEVPLDKTVANLERKLHSPSGQNALRARLHQINRQKSGFSIFSNTELDKESAFINMVLEGTIAQLLHDIQYGSLQKADQAFETLRGAWPYKHSTGYLVREISGTENRLNGLLGSDIMQHAERCLLSRPDYLKAHGDRFYQYMTDTKAKYENMQKQGKQSGLKIEEQKLHSALMTREGRTDLSIKARFIIVQKILSDPFTKSCATIANGPLKQAKQEIRCIEQQIFSQLAKQGITDPVQINNMLPESPFHQQLITIQTLFEERPDFQQEFEVEQVTHLYPIDELAQAATENSDLLEVYRSHNFGNAARLELRIEKLEQISQGTIVLSYQIYDLSADAIGMLIKEGFDPKLYQECSGNQFQQLIHQECIDIVEELAYPNQDVLARECSRYMLHFVDAARAYNQANSPLEAMTVTDVCWSIFDCIKAAGEGVIEGTIGTIINHPIETVGYIVAPQYMLAYHIGKVAVNLIDIKVTSLMDQEAGEQKLADYLKPLTACIDAISNREFTLRGSIKAAATVATQVAIQGKLTTGLKALYETTKKRAKNYLQTNPLATAKQYVATADGRILQAAGGPGKNTVSMKEMRGKGQKNPSTNNWANKNKAEINNSNFKLQWTPHGWKHAPPKNIPWKKIVKSTKHGDAMYKPDINIQKTELYAWEKGQISTKMGKNWKVFKSNEIIGACSGKETYYMRVECSANTIHGHPITETEYLDLIK